jgi:2,4-dienoyl-CoA reductase (NADPH2)
MGAGGLGFDVAEFLAHDGVDPLNVEDFLKEWGIDHQYQSRGGLLQKQASPNHSKREITLLQRKKTKMGASLGKTTGWIHRAALKKNQVKMIEGVNYVKIDDLGLHVTINGKPQILEADHIILCTGQVPNDALFQLLTSKQIKVTKIGGADVASELDAKRAILQASELAAVI